MKKNYIKAETNILEVFVENSFLGASGEIGGSGEEGGDFDDNGGSGGTKGGIDPWGDGYSF